MIKVFNKFYPKASELRKHFEGRFANPRQTSPDRFVWDWWHVPGQYTLLRTPAYHFFPKKIYEPFHQHLALWGRRNLGCHDISPPWISVYVQGCRQELHGDFPHGPWAYVFSLTDWKKRKFSGGETLLIKDSVLNHWNSFESGKMFESEQVFTKVEPLFNRLTLFDPRIPHGVSPVEGVLDPAKARVVVHGWFVNPRPYIEGPLSTVELRKQVDELTRQLGEALGSADSQLHGTLSLRFSVKTNGEVTDVRTLFSNVRAVRATDVQVPAQVERLLKKWISSYRFRRQKSGSGSKVTLPIQFEI